MKFADYHAKYFAHELTRRCPSDSVEKLAGAVAGAQVDLNPHQEKFFLPCEILETKSYNAAVRQGKFRPFEAEAEKLDGWADDLKLGLEREFKDLDRRIKEARRAALTALTLEEKLAGQKQIKALEAQRNEKRRSLFEAQDKVDQQRDALIASIERKLTQNRGLTQVFTIRWKLA